VTGLRQGISVFPCQYRGDKTGLVTGLCLGISVFPCQYRGDETGTVTGLRLGIRVFPCQYHSTKAHLHVQFLLPEGQTGEVSES